MVNKTYISEDCYKDKEKQDGKVKIIGLGNFN